MWVTLPLIGVNINRVGYHSMAFSHSLHFEVADHFLWKLRCHIGVENKMKVMTYDFSLHVITVLCIFPLSSSLHPMAYGELLCPPWSVVCCLCVHPSSIHKISADIVRPIIWSSDSVLRPLQKTIEKMLSLKQPILNSPGCKEYWQTA